MPKKTPVSVSSAALPIISEDVADSQGVSMGVGVGGVEAITLMMQQMMRQQVEQVTDLNRKLEEMEKKKKKSTSKKVSNDATEKRILAKAKLLYYYDIRDKTVAWANTVIIQIEALLQENPRLWEILDKEIPTDVLKKITYKHFDRDVPENIRQEYLEKAKVEIQG